MKRLYVYTLSCFLAVSVLLATAGIPLIAHVCNMSCKKEIRVIAGDDCCKKNHPQNHSSNLSKGPCCDSETFFLKQELPATKVVKSSLPLLSVLAYVLVSGNDDNYFSPTFTIQHDSPPLRYGRTLLTHIQVLRT